MSNESERLQDIEVRLTFLDDAVGSLSEADASLSQRLLAIEQALRTLRNEITALRAAVGHDAHDEPPPPHY